MGRPEWATQASQWAGESTASKQSASALLAPLVVHLFLAAARARTPWHSGSCSPRSREAGRERSAGELDLLMVTLGRPPLDGVRPRRLLEIAKDGALGDAEAEQL